MKEGYIKMNNTDWHYTITQKGKDGKRRIIADFHTNDIATLKEILDHRREKGTDVKSTNTFRVVAYPDVGFYYLDNYLCIKEVNGTSVYSWATCWIPRQDKATCAII